MWQRVSKKDHCNQTKGCIQQHSSAIIKAIQEQRSEYNWLRNSLNTSTGT